MPGGQQAKQGAGECGIPLAGRGQCDGVRCGRGQEVGALDADLAHDGFLIAGLVGQGTPAETAVEDDHLLGGAAVGHHSSELVVGHALKGSSIRISAGQAQEQLVAAAGPAMAGEIDQQRVLGARRMLAQRAVDLDRRGRFLPQPCNCPQAALPAQGSIRASRNPERLLWTAGRSSRWL